MSSEAAQELEKSEPQCPNCSGDHSYHVSLAWTCVEIQSSVRIAICLELMMWLLKSSIKVFASLRVNIALTFVHATAVECQVIAQVLEDVVMQHRRS